MSIGVLVAIFAAGYVAMARHGTSADVPHRHLAILAVHPSRQAHGVGSALLRHCHRELDHAGEPAYLEPSSEGSRDLYLRHGYRLLPDGPFHLPGDGPPFWPMWRPSQPDAAP